MERRVERINHDTLGMMKGNNTTMVNLTVAVPTYQMKPTDTCMVVTSDAADAAGILYLPSMVEAAGKLYYIIAPTGATAGDISVTIKETATELATYGDMDADADWALFFCDGIGWRLIASSGTF